MRSDQEAPSIDARIVYLMEQGSRLNLVTRKNRNKCIKVTDLFTNQKKEMNRAKNTSIIILSVIVAGCGGGSKQSSDYFVTVDVTASYPKIELILQDFMDVEYIPESINYFV